MILLRLGRTVLVLIIPSAEHTRSAAIHFITRHRFLHESISYAKIFYRFCENLLALRLQETMNSF